MQSAEHPQGGQPVAVSDGYDVRCLGPDVYLAFDETHPAPVDAIIWMGGEGGDLTSICLYT
jgi:hypothetical protein